MKTTYWVYISEWQATKFDTLKAARRAARRALRDQPERQSVDVFKEDPDVEGWQCLTLVAREVQPNKRHATT